MEQKQINVGDSLNLNEMSDLIKLSEDVFNQKDEHDIILFETNPLKYMTCDPFNLEIISFIKETDKKGTFKKYKYKFEKELLNVLKNLKNNFEKEGFFIKSEFEDILKGLDLSIKSKKPSKIKKIVKKDRFEHLTTIKEGNFLYTCWGYDQTNTEFFKVLKIIGKNYFIIREVSQYNDPDKETKMVYSDVLPTDEFISYPIKAYISNDGYMSICESGYKRGLLIWDKKSKYKTNTQFGH